MIRVCMKMQLDFVAAIESSMRMRMAFVIALNLVLVKVYRVIPTMAIPIQLSP